MFSNMKIFTLLISFLALATCTIADDSSTKQQGDHNTALVDLFHSVLTVYVRDKFLEERDVLEFAEDMEKIFVGAGMDYKNKITMNDAKSLSILPSLSSIKMGLA